MRLRVSACGAAYVADGQVVWDDYLDHRQFVLGDEADVAALLSSLKHYISYI